MFAWEHSLSTTDPEYYRWTQWVFLQLYHRGLAYKKKGAVNWCPSDKTVLSNEQVIGGACERCGAVVEQRVLEQWYFRITDYAERLLANLDDKAKMDWSESTVLAQKNWIGRSEGAELHFSINGSTESVAVFTTRPDTIFGATFMVLAPEHPLVDILTSPEQRDTVAAYRAQAAARDLTSRKIGDKENRVSHWAGTRQPGHGRTDPGLDRRLCADGVRHRCIMGVPGHDERDFAFAPSSAADRPGHAVGPDDATTPLEAAHTDTDGGRLSIPASRRPVRRRGRSTITPGSTPRPRDSPW